MIDSNSNLPVAIRVLWLVSALLFVVLSMVTIARDGRDTAVAVGVWVSIVAFAVANVGLWVVLFI